MKKESGKELLHKVLSLAKSIQPMKKKALVEICVGDVLSSDPQTMVCSIIPGLVRGVGTKVILQALITLIYNDNFRGFYELSSSPMTHIFREIEQNAEEYVDQEDAVVIAEILTRIEILLDKDSFTRSNMVSILEKMGGEEVLPRLATYIERLRVIQTFRTEDTFADNPVVKARLEAEIKNALIARHNIRSRLLGNGK